VYNFCAFWQGALDVSVTVNVSTRRAPFSRLPSGHTQWRVPLVLHSAGGVTMVNVESDVRTSVTLRAAVVPLLLTWMFEVNALSAAL